MNFTLFSIFYFAAVAAIVYMIAYPEKTEKIIDKIIGGMKN